jgi:2-phosphosulfolactate phosphatase
VRKPPILQRRKDELSKLHMPGYRGGMIEVLFHPSELAGRDASNAQVVVLDVLRATSTMVAALSNGAREIRLFDTLDSARAAKRAWAGGGPAALAGESRCLKPDDFDLGNSPREQVTEKVGGAAVLLATTNGTRAAVAARSAGASALFAGSLLNAAATARALMPQLDARDILFLCAGTDGRRSLEDVLGAGAAIFALLQATYRTDLAFTDSAWMAYHAYAAVRTRLAAALRLGQGGINLMGAGLEEDIDFCARVDALDRVVGIDGELVAR